MRSATLTWDRCRGRNGYDPAGEISDDMAAAAVNVTLRRGAIARKRDGSTTRTFSGDPFSGYNQLATFVPGQNDAAAELHFVSRDATSKILRVAAGTAAANLTLKDNIASLPQNAVTAVLNGKLFWAYDSTVNRLHCYDPSESTTKVRRVGFSTPAVPTMADTGSAGSYAATLRYYRVRWLVVASGRVKRQSDSVNYDDFTPSGTKTGVVVTQPTVASEDETHWQVEVSLDAATWFVLSGQIAIGTTTYTDTTATTAYADLELAHEPGAYKPPPSAKYVISTGDRLVMYGMYETAAGDSILPKNGRVAWTPVLGSSNDESDDDERVSDTVDTRGYMDISRDAGSEDRGIAGPMDGQIFTFQSRGITMLVPTGNEAVPYRRVALSTVLGSVSHVSQFIGEDEAGRPCVYFLDPSRGPYRYGANGFQWCGYDVQDVWSTVNQAATNRVAHGVFNPETRKAIWWIATGSSNDPDTCIVFHVREGQPTVTEGVRYGWTTYGGDMAAARCSTMFASTFGSTMSRSRHPYAGFSSDAYYDAVMALSPLNYWRMDETTGSTLVDSGTGADNITLNGSPTLGVLSATGYRALQADGSNDYGTVTLAATTTTFWMAGWLTPDSTQTDQLGTILWDTVNGGLFYDRSSRKLNYRVSGVSKENTTALTDGVAVHWALSVSGGTGTFYINGVADGTVTGITDMSHTRCIGTDASNGRLKGVIHDLAFKAGATLTAAQALALATVRRASLLKCEDSSVTADHTNAFQAYVTSRAWKLDPIEMNKELLSSRLQAASASGVTITQSLTRNYGDETVRTATALLTALNGETRGIRRFEAAALADAFTFQVTLGDSAAVSNGWTLDRWIGELRFSDDARGNRV